MRNPRLAFAALLFALSCQPATAAPRCKMAPADKAWLDGALQASDYVIRQRLQLPAEMRPTILVFDNRCRFEAKGSVPDRWIAIPHEGKIRLPDGKQVDAGVTSFASQVEKSGERFFVMALPTVWQAAGINKLGDAGLTGVFLHEFSHTRQLNALKPAFDAAAAIYKMPDDFSDDSLQKHFENDPTYVAVYEKESDLLYRAAAEPDMAKAKGLAKQALTLIEARQKRWFAGDDAMWKPYDDLFLTMEGFGQWNAYAWLSDPKGGGMTRAAAQDKMRGGHKWWSQEEGLALFLVIDRFVPGWAAQAFAVRPKLGIDLLRQAVAG
jgi:hypothetical protein